eukprot:365602-Chlamydomonas_euryale.AAC.21
MAARSSGRFPAIAATSRWLPQQAIRKLKDPSGRGARQSLLTVRARCIWCGGLARTSIRCLAICKQAAGIAAECRQQVLPQDCGVCAQPLPRRTHHTQHQPRRSGTAGGVKRVKSLQQQRHQPAGSTIRCGAVDVWTEATCVRVWPALSTSAGGDLTDPLNPTWHMPLLNKKAHMHGPCARARNTRGHSACEARCRGRAPGQMARRRQAHRLHQRPKVMQHGQSPGLDVEAALRLG